MHICIICTTLYNIYYTLLHTSNTVYSTRWHSPSPFSYYYKEVYPTCHTTQHLWCDDSISSPGEINGLNMLHWHEWRLSSCDLTIIYYTTSRTTWHMTHYQTRIVSSIIHISNPHCYTCFRMVMVHAGCSLSQATIINLYTSNTYRSVWFTGWAQLVLNIKY